MSKKKKISDINLIKLLNRIKANSLPIAIDFTSSVKPSRTTGVGCAELGLVIHNVPNNQLRFIFSFEVLPVL